MAGVIEVERRLITVADLATGEVLSVHLIEPTNTYWRNQNRKLGADV
jgi:hypothetical protein